MRTRAIATSIVVTLALPALLLAAWWIASATSTSFFFPPLSEIFSVFPDTWLGERLLGDVVPSLLRLFVGYGIALVVGVGLGLPIGLSSTLRYLTEPVFEFARAIPPPVLIPILGLIFGIGPSMKIFVIAFGCLWPVLLNTIDGVRGIDPVLLDTAKSYGIRPSTQLRTVILRGASPRIAAGARQALSLGIILMVVSEMFYSIDGLGYTIVQFQRGFDIPQMWTGIILLGIIGILLATIFRFIERRVLAWYYGFRQSERGVN